MLWAEWEKDSVKTSSGTRPLVVSSRRSAPWRTFICLNSGSGCCFATHSCETRPAYPMLSSKTITSPLACKGSRFHGGVLVLCAQSRTRTVYTLLLDAFGICWNTDYLCEEAFGPNKHGNCLQMQFVPSTPRAGALWSSQAISRRRLCTSGSASEPTANTDETASRATG